MENYNLPKHDFGQGVMILNQDQRIYFENVLPFIECEEDVKFIRDLDKWIDFTKLIIKDDLNDDKEIKKDIFVKVKPKTVEILLRIKKNNSNNYLKIFRQMIQNKENIKNFDFLNEISNQLSVSENEMFKEQLFQVYVENIIRKGIGDDVYKSIIEKIKDYSRFSDGTLDNFDNGERNICDYEFKEGHYYIFSPSAPIIYIEKIEEGLRRYVFCYCDGTGKKITPLLTANLIFKVYQCREIPKMFFLSSKLDLI